MALLEIKNLTLFIDAGDETVKALEKVNLTLNEGEIRALVGESGSGKTLIVRAILGAIPDNWSIKADRITYQGKSLLDMSGEQRRQIMRREIAVVFQEPASALDPSVKIKEQIKESIPDEFITKAWPWKQNKQREELTVNLLHRVGIKNHKRYMECYPHEIPTDISQKIMIAMALASEPKILIADDSTRGMESATKTQILRLLLKFNETKKLAILFVSHDLLAITSMAHSMTVLYCGQTVESGKVKSLLKRPLHPYTKALLDSAPSFQVSLPPKSKLVTLEGTIPTLQHLPTGCRLGPRCPNARKECVMVPVPRNIQDHLYSCHFPLHLPKNTKHKVYKEVKL
ncbi:oligopeptide/dipeptide ABC transporter ATP-binding protein [Agaribacter marinus]|uniref:ABC transporter ATP-binding protein n=1 Tax=Agaribacter marinus TaxID=1431249 RepID=A0AA37WI76_9ALTE|nr:oligopeptide/dipeptide ABC transporter ATP-binding protein [Agaribacter marinus]GLR70667.1 ABC transporter ATP-binding protein [Agaribacter marinus]